MYTEGCSFMTSTIFGHIHFPCHHLELNTTTPPPHTKPVNDFHTGIFFYLVYSHRYQIWNSMQPRPIASRTMAPHHLPPLQELLGHGHVAARLLLRPQAHCLPSLDVLEYLGLLHQNNLSWPLHVDGVNRHLSDHHILYHVSNVIIIHTISFT